MENPFIPLKWMKDHKGMQGTEYMDSEESEKCKFQWLKAREMAVLQATRLAELGLTKQICNRILEPFMWHTVIVTGTEWENFFALRAHEAAEIHMQELANVMLKAYNDSTPNGLQAGDWHIPFGQKIDDGALFGQLVKTSDDSKTLLEAKIKIATARCARVSYTVVGEEGKPDNYAADIKLHDRLAEAGHWSPFEHCAKVIAAEMINNLGWSGNFRGFKQYRKLFINENKKDARVRKAERTSSAV